ncbi:XdhC family protein [Tahibacter harae]|uniref:XdhC family protein n=1 Tax=Tahibacter harae TaxID=2963937 RepID=A0ABT1QUK4_9GAMM|nr:XdhC/CoxI family protein [Tahibacter harae]MCQ4165962.1 XdhC family protein [Tahibacter harae]
MGDPTANGTDSGGSLRALLQAIGADSFQAATLAVVVDTQGSTYRKPGALILLARAQRRGWLSGGCLEAELEQAAAEVAAQGRARHLTFDTRSDDDLVFGSASGCRGIVELMLLPLTAQAPLRQALCALALRGPLDLQLDTAGGGMAAIGAQRWAWPGAMPAPPRWRLRLRAPPRLLLLGAGPESVPLLRLARLLGWQSELVEQRARWAAAAAAADSHHDLPAGALAPLLAAGAFDAALVMSHHYSRDLDALRLCAQSDIPWIGLLGPPARRDALLGELDELSRARLRPRLQAPVGLRLGGEGPEAIALSIVAALQSHIAGGTP